MVQEDHRSRPGARPMGVHSGRAQRLRRELMCRYLPRDFRQEVQTRRLTSRPPSMIRVFWMLGFQRRRVAFFDQGRLFPYIGVLGQ